MESNTLLISRGRKRLKSTQVFLVAAIILLTLFITLLCIGFLVRYEVDTDVSHIESISYWKDEIPPQQQVWYDEAIEELNIALKMRLRKDRPRNALIFVATGITPTALAAVRFENVENKPKSMVWDKFPHLGRLKNSCSNTEICDLQSVATALFGGVRTNFNVGGFDQSVSFRNCSAALNETHKIKSIFAQAQEIGLRTGIVTKKRVTGPLVASLYAHTPDTDWECDATIARGLLASGGCKDIGQQLIENSIGNNINVIMGGGRQALVTNVPTNEWDPIDETACNSEDNRNLIRDWQMKNLKQKRRFAVLEGSEDVAELDGRSVDYVLGVFTNGDAIDSDHPKAKLRPKLLDMTSKTIEILRRKESGFLLLVEAGVPSEATISEQVKELLSLNEVIERTLFGNDSLAEESLTLVAFTTGNYRATSVDVSAEVNGFLDLGHIGYSPEVLEEIYSSIATETMIYARGPKSNLFHGVHEETYMAHAVSHALKMGQFAGSS